jgi:hypothetical protein
MERSDRSRAERAAAGLTRERAAAILCAGAGEHHAGHTPNGGGAANGRDANSSDHRDGAEGGTKYGAETGNGRPTAGGPCDAGAGCISTGCSSAKRTGADRGSDG